MTLAYGQRDCPWPNNTLANFLLTLGKIMTLDHDDLVSACRSASAIPYMGTFRIKGETIA